MVIIVEMGKILIGYKNSGILITDRYIVKKLNSFPDINSRNHIIEPSGKFLLLCYNTPNIIIKENLSPLSEEKISLVDNNLQIHATKIYNENEYKDLSTKILKYIDETKHKDSDDELKVYIEKNILSEIIIKDEIKKPEIKLKKNNRKKVKTPTPTESESSDDENSDCDDDSDIFIFGKFLIIFSVNC